MQARVGNPTWQTAPEEPSARLVRPQLHVSTSPLPDTNFGVNFDQNNDASEPALDTPQVARRAMTHHSGKHTPVRMARPCTLSTIFRSTSRKPSSAIKSSLARTLQTTSEGAAAFGISHGHPTSAHQAMTAPVANTTSKKRVRFSTAPAETLEGDHKRKDVEIESTEAELEVNLLSTVSTAKEQDGIRMPRQQTPRHRTSKGTTTSGRELFGKRDWCESNGEKDGSDSKVCLLLFWIRRI
jgi:hypothetical protein